MVLQAQSTCLDYDSLNREIRRRGMSMVRYRFSRWWVQPVVPSLPPALFSLTKEGTLFGQTGITNPAGGYLTRDING